MQFYLIKSIRGLFAATLFLSGALLFVVEPMFAKMALPKLGGTPAVWNVCMVCYQALLLAGYSFSHALAKRFSPRRTSLLQMGLVLAVFFALPIRLPEILNSPLKSNPTFWLLMLVISGLGLPFFVLSTYSSILQTWYASTSHVAAKNPYVLYSASNLGNLVGLAAYLVILEPRFGLTEQSRLWQWGYAVLVVLTACCALCLWFVPPARKIESEPDQETTSQPTARQQLKWLALAFLPSSLMLGITTAITSELPPIPLLWVLPLTVYLFSFILVFAGKLTAYHRTFIDTLPILLIVIAFPIVSKNILPPILSIPFYLVTLFFACMVCHGELARIRPTATHLTRFYLCVSFGGVLGGLFNAIVAPSIFNSIAEVPIALFLLALATSRMSFSAGRQPLNKWDVLVPAIVGLAVATAGIWSQLPTFKPGRWLDLAVFVVPLLFCFSLSKRPMRFAFGLGALFLSSTPYSGQYGHVLLSKRSFFGVYKVTERGQYRQLFHGSTIHGIQSMDPVRASESLSYYYETGPVGQLFRSSSLSRQLREVGVVGLGAGSLACYSEPWRHFTFYEIDPSVETIASDPQYFTFLRDCSPGSRVVIGDARLSLAAESKPKYDILIVDAFGSDTIPVHLVTAEAIELYVSTLTDHGLLAFNITNRYLDMKPILSKIAQHAGLAAVVQDDPNIATKELDRGKFASVWVLMARRRADFGSLGLQPKWHDLQLQAGTRLWTDDYSSLVSIIHWD
jgi:spermidine synthase